MTIDIDGQTHTGTLIITGTRKLTFTVEYSGRTHTDSRSWGTDAEEMYNLRVMAQAHLVQLVFEAGRTKRLNKKESHGEQ